MVRCLLTGLLGCSAGYSLVPCLLKRLGLMSLYIEQAADQFDGLAGVQGIAVSSDITGKFVI